MNLKIYNRVIAINAQLGDIEKTRQSLIAEREKYYWKINLYNSSDSFGEFRKDNPKHPLLQYCNVQIPAQSGWLSDVSVRILRCDISKEDFLAFVKLIVLPRVEHDTVNLFESNIERERHERVY